MQRKLSYAIVDEVDSILIDEARTPLIISGPAEDSSELYYRVNELIPKLYARRRKRRKRTGAQEISTSMRRRAKSTSPRLGTSMSKI